MQRGTTKLFSAVAGLLAGIAIWILLYYLLMLMMDVFGSSSARVRIPVFFFALPLITAWVGWKLGDVVYLEGAQTASHGWKALNATVFGRLALVVPPIWALTVAGYTLSFEPFGSRIDEREMLFVAKLVSFPVVIFWLCVVAAWFVFSPPSRKD
jgi:hypothetical protein